MDLNKNLNTDLKSLPSQPGVYRFLNREGKVIYVGKARDLKKRVGSYFSGKPQSAKEKILVKNIARIETIVVDTEYDALLLENSMIKELQPRYNILLKDDKTYPWICIKKERFPRVFPTRTLVRDGSEYFGPYASVKVMNNLLELIRGIFPLRNCTFDLSEENIAKKKFRICLEYQIGNCLGPCEGLQSQVDYDDSIKKIRAILRGKSGEVARSLKEEIQKYVSDLAFEKAQKTKEKLLLLEKFQAKSTVVSPQLGDLDVFSVHEDQGTGYLNFFRVSEGAIVGSHNMELKQKLEENSYDFLLLGLTELLRKFPPKHPGK
jgi:excinuclease ABC subunit C